MGPSLPAPSSPRTGFSSSDAVKFVQISVFLAMALAIAARGQSSATNASPTLPASVAKENAAKLTTARYLSAHGSPESKDAAKAFTTSITTLSAKYKAHKIGDEELKQGISESFNTFQHDARLVKLEIKATPAGCAVQWKPVLFGTWTDMNDQGAYVGYGRTIVRVSKDGFRPKEITIETMMDPTVQTITLEPVGR